MLEDPKKFQFSVFQKFWKIYFKNGFTGTSQIVRETKSPILVILALLMRKLQTNVWCPGHIDPCPPEIGLTLMCFFIFTKIPVSWKNMKNARKILPISGRHGSIWPEHHTFVCSIHMSRARISKIGDFVSLTIWLVPKRHFWNFFCKIFEKLNI